MIRPEIYRGMALFDSHVPDWPSHINLDMLDVSNCSQCPVAQVYESNYSTGCLALGIHIVDGSLYGFSLPVVSYHSGPDWQVLTDEWKRAIAERIAASYGQ